MSDPRLTPALRRAVMALPSGRSWGRPEDGDFMACVSLSVLYSDLVQATRRYGPRGRSETQFCLTLEGEALRQKLEQESVP